MSAAIDRIINGVLDGEGGEFTNDPNDTGGPTKWGITQKTYSAYLGRPATIENVEQLTSGIAFQIYRKMYVLDPGFEQVAIMSELIADELVDSGVNCGVGTASIWLQKILNALNRQQKDWPDIVEDGVLGTATFAALNRCLAKRNKVVVGYSFHITEVELVIWRYLNALQGAYYIQLGERHKNDEEFIFGWGLNRLGGRV